MLTTGDQTMAIRVWEIQADHASLLSTIGGPKLSPQNRLFSPDSQLLAVAEHDGNIGLWRPRSGHLLATLTGHRGIVREISFSPDGRTLASVGEDRQFRLWHVATQRELLRFDMPADYGKHWGRCRFSSDGRTLVVYIGPTGGKTNVNRILFAPSFDEIALEEKTELARPNDPSTWNVRARVLAKRERLQDAVQAFGEVIQGCAGQPHLEALRGSAFANRAQLHKRLGRLAEAGADNCAALEIPARDPNVPARLLDLSPYFTDSLERNSFGQLIPNNDPFLGLPRGRQKLAALPEIEFDLRGVIQVNCESDRPGIPHAVENISVRQKCRRLHFLHNAYRLDNQDIEEDEVIATYVVHYVDGKREEIPVFSDTDMRSSRGAIIAWEKKGVAQLTSRPWVNPHPDVEIRSLDFVSKMAKRAPFLVAITAEP